MTHIEVLAQAKEAIQDCLGVMQNELKGLAVIQPEIRVATASIASIDSLPTEIGQTSDGYHTFDELYEHRFALWIALCREISNNPSHQNIDVWKCKQNPDGSSWDGWFILGMDVYGQGREEKAKQMSYHLPMKHWWLCQFATWHHQPHFFDGHTSADVLERLKSL